MWVYCIPIYIYMFIYIHTYIYIYMYGCDRTYFVQFGAPGLAEGMVMSFCADLDSPMYRSEGSYRPCLVVL